MTTTESLFNKMYSAGKDVIDAARKPLAEKKLKRKFQVAWDNADAQKIDAEESLNNCLEKIDSYNLSKVLEYKTTIKDADQIKKQIEEHYLQMFGEEMQTK